MANLKAIRVRITSVRKTQKITKAMKMVSAAKLARAQNAVQATRPYAAKLRQVLGSVSAGVDADAHPLLTRREVRRLDVVVFTSDRGLCGAFNTNVVKSAQRLIAERQAAGLERVTIVGVGRRGADFFRKRGFQSARTWTGLATPAPENAVEVAALLMERFLTGESDQVVLVYGEFKSAVTQTPRSELLLPFTPEASAGPAAAYAVEPSPEELLGLILPRAVEFAVFRAMLETAASEHGARMTAMDSATNNSAEVIRSLTLDMNKARQAAITQELSEIVGGAEAL